MITTNEQVGGTHYRDKGIQPIEYIQTNKLSFCEGNVIKYVTRHRDKNGLEDLKKAMQYLKFLMESEYNYVEGLPRVRPKKGCDKGCGAEVEAPPTYRDAAAKCDRNLPFDYDVREHSCNRGVPTGSWVKGKYVANTKGEGC